MWSVILGRRLSHMDVAVISNGYDCTSESRRVNCTSCRVDRRGNTSRDLGYLWALNKQVVDDVQTLATRHIVLCMMCH